MTHPISFLLIAYDRNRKSLRRYLSALLTNLETLRKRNTGSPDVLLTTEAAQMRRFQTDMVLKIPKLSKLVVITVPGICGCQ